MGRSRFKVLIACGKGEEERIVRRSLGAKGSPLALSHAANLAELRSTLKRGWEGLLLLSETFSRKPFDALLQELHDTYGLPPTILLLRNASPGHRSIAYKRGCYGWLTLEDFSQPGTVDFIVSIGERARLDREVIRDISNYKTILDRLGEGVAITDASDVITFRNDALARITGADKVDIVNKPLLAITPPAVHATVVPHLEMLKKGKSCRFDFVLDLGRGDPRHLEVNATPRVAEGGDYGGAIFVVHDATDRFRTEARLRESEDLYRSLAQNIPRTAVFLFDRSMRYTLAEGHLLQELGYDRDAIVGHTFKEVIAPGAQKVVRPLYEAALDGRELVVQQSIGDRTYTMISTAVRDDDGAITGGMVMAQDITALQSAAAMMEAQIELGGRLSTASRSEEALSAALAIALKVSNLERGTVYRRHAATTDYQLVHEVGLSEAPGSIPDDPGFLKRLRIGDPVWSLKRWSFPSPLSEMVRANAALIPLGGGPHAPAFLLLCGEGHPELNEGARDALRAIAALVGHALARIDADEERRRTSQYLRGIVDSQNDMVVRVDTRGRYVFANDAYCRKFGLDPEALIGQEYIPEVHPDDRPRSLRALARVRRPPYRVSIEHRVKTVEGWRWLAWENFGILNDEGEVVEIQGVSRDITEQHQIETALRASEAKLKAIFNNTLQAFVLFDREACILALNHLAIWDRMQSVGQRMEEGHSILEYALPNEMPRFGQAIKRVLRGETMKYESHTTFRNGESRWYEIQLIPVYDDQGSISGGLLTTIDINDRKIALEALERSEQRFRSLVQNSSDIISILGEDAVLQYQTAAAERVLGYSLDEMLGSSIFDYVHPEDLDEVVNKFQELIRNPSATIPVEFRFRHRDESWIYLEAIATNRLNDPEIRGVVVTSRDITERRRSEEQLRLLATAIGNAEEAVVITDAQLEKPGPHIVFVNEGFTRISGYAPREVLGKTPRILQGPKTDRKMLDRLKVEIGAGKSFSAETTNYRKDGSEYIVEWRISPVFDVGGRITHYVSIQRDITDRKAAEDALQSTADELKQRNEQLELARREADKARVAVERAAEELRRAYEDAAAARRVAEQANEAKSQFLASMSHEIRTPMTAILGFARLFRERAVDDESKGFVDQVLTAGEHLLSLINDILDLSRVESGRLTIEPEPISLKELVREVHDLFVPLAEKKGLRLEVEQKDLPPGVVLDRGRIRQVMTNLVANAIKFTDEGRVDLRVEARKDRQGVRFEVADTGPGIPEELREKIFEPFYQVQDKTRTVREGTGLGLAITARIVQAMGGTIQVDSNGGAGGHGTTFVVQIPCSFVEKGMGQETAEATTRIDRTKVPRLRVLVADDHEPNRMLIRHVLEARGHEVILAENGLQAVDAFLDRPVDIVVMDVQMPVMDGHQAIREIRSTPGGDRVPILTLTAYAMRGDRERSLAVGADDYVSKPFEPGRLADKIESMATRRAAGESVRSGDPELDALRRDYLADLIGTAETYLKALPSAEDLAMWGHRVAGSGGSFGYPALTTEGRIIERAGNDQLAEGEAPVRESLERLLGHAQQALADLPDADPPARD